VIAGVASRQMTSHQTRRAGNQNFHNTRV
jgi:hypothetical protein